MPSQPPIQLLSKYCVDTNIFLDFWNIDDPNLRYPIDLNKSKWIFFTERIKNGQIIAPHEVRDELDRSGNKKLVSWVSAHSFMFVDCFAIPGYVKNIDKVVNLYPAYTAERGDHADVVLIAMSKSLNKTVLSAEYLVPTHSPAKPKIPNVCKEAAVNVNCCNFNEFLREEGYQEP